MATLTEVEPLTAAPVLNDHICIHVTDAMNRRLIEGVAAQLNLHLQDALMEELIALASSNTVAMIIADEGVASELRHLPAFSLASSDVVAPALVAVLPGGISDVPVLPKRDTDRPYDGVLVLPQTPAVLLAQLGVILYAHRTYVQRLESAWEELQLNRRIFRSVTAGITVASAAGDLPLTYVNPAFEVMTGYSLEEVMGRNCRFLQGEERDQPGLKLIREAIKEKRETVALLRNFRKDGSLFWNELSISPIMDRFGAVTHYVGIQNDVTMRVAALRDSEKLANVGRLAATIAHEINNPLATATNLVYLANNEDSEEQRKHLLDMAEKELNRVALLTTQSLRFYRQSSKPTPVRAADLVAEVLDVYSVKLTNLHLSLERRYLPCEPVVCVESEIRQVISNFLRNAMDAFEGKEGRIFVRVREATDRKTTQGVLITFADTGCGMAPTTKERLFTAFHTTKDQQGTGLGLWVSKEIIDRHRGRISVRTRQAKPCGTVFQLFLPYQSQQP